MPDIAASSADARRAGPRDDRALLAACRGGDARAFVTLVRRHHPALRALAGCWPGAAHEAEHDVAQAWLAVLGRDASSGSSVRARVAREIQATAVARTHAALEPSPTAALDASRFFAADHELWPGEWADPPRPWGSAADRRLGQADIPRALARIVRELGIAPSAVLTLCDLHGWPVGECAFALERPEAQVRAFLQAGREGVRAALEQEVDSV